MQTPETARHSRRRPWIAVLLSLVCGGLGQVYCGRIAKGLVLMLLAGGLGPVVGVLALIGSFGGPTAAVVAVFAVPNLVWLYAVVDAYFLARKHGRDYQLKDYNRWYVYLVFLLMFIPISLTFALLVREGFLEAFRVAADSMLPTISKGDRVLADKRVYRAEPVERGDVIVFINPNQRHVRYIKRVVARPNDTIEMKDNVLFVNGGELPRTKDSGSPTAPANGESDVFWETNGLARYRILLDRHEPVVPTEMSDIPNTTIPPGHCYVLGDNRNHSRDSRHFGPIPLVDVVGRVERVYFPEWRKVE